jgi:TRAP-type C4-dicarboxylate transport system permease large subunit
VIVAAFSGRMDRTVIRESLEATVTLTGMIMLIIAGATVVTYVVGILGIPGALSETIVGSGLPVWFILALIALLFLVLGCFIESVSLIVLTIPVLHPVMSALEVSGVWLGIYVVVLVEVGLLTPPVGLNLFVLQKIPAGQTLGDITAGVVPYLLALAVLLVALVAVPDLATWLPSHM